MEFLFKLKMFHRKKIFKQWKIIEKRLTNPELAIFPFVSNFIEFNNII